LVNISHKNPNEIVPEDWFSKPAVASSAPLGGTLSIAITNKIGEYFTHKP